MLIRIADPQGTVPAITPRMLPDNMAQTAINAKFGNREIRPVGGQTSEVAAIYNGVNTLALHRYPDSGGTLGTLTQTAAAVEGPSSIRHCSLSPDGKWLAVALTASPYVAIYAVSGAALTAPTSPAIGNRPGGQGNAVAWSPDGSYVFLANTGAVGASPISAWPWTGAWGARVTVGNENVVFNCIAVSDDGGYVTVGTNTAPYMRVYPWTGAFGSPVAPITANQPAGAVNGVIFDRTTGWIVAAHTTTPYVTAWSWNGVALGVKISPDSLATGNGTSIAMSPDGLYVAITQTGAPYVRAWRFKPYAVVQPFEYLLAETGVTAPTAQANVISWDRRGGFLFIGITGAPRMEGYAWGLGGRGRKLTPGSNPAADVTGLAFSTDSAWCYCCFADAGVGKGAVAIDRTSVSWFNWNQRVRARLGPAYNDTRNRRFYTGDGGPKKTGNDIGLPAVAPNKAPADWYNMGVKRPGKVTADQSGSMLLPISAGAISSDWSPNGRYLAVGNGSSPYVHVYDMLDPEHPVKMADLGAPLAGAGNGVKWNLDGTFIAVAYAGSPFVAKIAFSSTGFGAVTLPAGADIPAGTGRGVAWSPDGAYIALAHQVAPYISAWPSSLIGKIVPLLGDIPTGDGYGVAFSPDGLFVSLAHTTVPYLNAWSFTGAAITGILVPATTPTGNGKGVSFRSDGAFIACAHTTSPFVSVYPWTGVFGTKIANPMRLPIADGLGVSWSPTGAFLAISQNNTALNIWVCTFTGSGFGTTVDDPHTWTVSTSSAVSWSPDEAYLAVSGSGFGSVYPWLSAPASRDYAMTYVTGWGEESAPSDVVTLAEANFNLPRLTFPTDVLTRYNITHRRIYRVTSGLAGATFQLVRELPISQTSFTDYVWDDDLLAGTLTTAAYAEPPSDLAGLVNCQGGFMAGYSPSLKQFCRSEIFAPHAWPVAYRSALAFNPVALGVSAASVIVATDGQPEIFDGLSPAGMRGSILEANQSCVSAASLVEVPGGVLYASPDGLFFVAPGHWENLTGPDASGKALLSKDDWAALRPSGMVGVLYDGKYYGIYDSDGAGTYKAIVLDLRLRSLGLVTVQAASGSIGNVGYYDPVTDKLYLVIAGAVKSWDTVPGSPMTQTWKSKKFTAPKPTSLSALQVRAAYAGTVTVRVYADGVAKDVKSVTSAVPVRLAGGYLAEEFEFQIESSIAVRELVAASSMNELKQAV